MYQSVSVKGGTGSNTISYVESQNPERCGVPYAGISRGVQDATGSRASLADKGLRRLRNASLDPVAAAHGSDT